MRQTRSGHEGSELTTPASTPACRRHHSRGTSPGQVTDPQTLPHSRTFHALALRPIQLLGFKRWAAMRWPAGRRALAVTMACCSVTRTSPGSAWNVHYQAQLTIPWGDQCHRGVAVRGAAYPDRPHRDDGVGPHHLDRVPVHSVPAHRGARPPDGAPPVAMIRRAVTIAAKQSDGHAAALHPLLADPLRAVLRLLRHLATVDNDDGVAIRDASDQLRPDRQHLVRLRQRVNDAPDAGLPQAVPGHPVGQHDRHG